MNNPVSGLLATRRLEIKTLSDNRSQEILKGVIIKSTSWTEFVIPTQIYIDPSMYIHIHNYTYGQFTTIHMYKPARTYIYIYTPVVRVVFKYWNRIYINQDCHEQLLKHYFSLKKYHWDYDFLFTEILLKYLFWSVVKRSVPSSISC